MELSLEVKGYLLDLIARESLGKLQIIGMRVGIAPETIQSLNPSEFMRGWTRGLLHTYMFESDVDRETSPNEMTALYIIENADNQDILIETVLDIAKREKIGGKGYTKIFAELNSLMERTMQCRMDEKWDIIPIFDPILQISEKRVYTERKLEEFGFNKTLTNYKSALKTYQIDYKGSISLFRSTFESLVDEIIISKGETLKSNVFRDKLIQLEKLGIIKEIDNQDCLKCLYRKKDSEFNYSYAIYSLLSHYGPHPTLITKEVANFLFTSTLVFVWFLINRYENKEAK